MVSPDGLGDAGVASLAADMVVADRGVPLGVADGVPALPAAVPVAASDGVPGAAAWLPAAGACTGAGACWVPEAWVPVAWPVAGTAGAGCGAVVPGAAGALACRVARCAGVSVGSGAADDGGAVLWVGVGLLEPDVGEGDGDGDTMPPIRSPMPTEIEAEGPSGLGDGVAACVAGTPAVRASTAPSAATAVPRRSPPW